MLFLVMCFSFLKTFAGTVLNVFLRTWARRVFFICLKILKSEIFAVLASQASGIFRRDDMNSYVIVMHEFINCMSSYIQEYEFIGCHRRKDLKCVVRRPSSSSVICTY